MAKQTSECTCSTVAYRNSWGLFSVIGIGIIYVIIIFPSLHFELGCNTYLDLAFVPIFYLYTMSLFGY